MGSNTSRCDLGGINELVCYLNYSLNISGNIPGGMIQISSLRHPHQHTLQGLLSYTATLPARGKCCDIVLSIKFNCINLSRTSIDQVLIDTYRIDKYRHVFDQTRSNIITKRANLRGASHFNFKFHHQQSERSTKIFPRVPFKLIKPRGNSSKRNVNLRKSNFVIRGQKGTPS